MNQPTFHVAPEGSDANPGTQEAPFASIDAARRAVREINSEMTDDIVVVLRGGTYRLGATVRFDARDSGMNGHDVIYVAEEGQEVVLSGGTVISGWQPDADGRWKVPCGEHFRQLYVNGSRAVRARSPERKLDGPAPCGHGRSMRIAPVAGIELLDTEGYRTTNISP